MGIDCCFQGRTMYKITLFMLAAVALQSTSAACPPGFVENTSTRICYKFVWASKLSWYRAAQFCSFMTPGVYKAFLVSVRTQAEHTWLRSYINSQSNLSGKDFWTSGSNIEDKQTWKWTATAEKMSYQDWAPGEPADDCGDAGCCAMLWGGSNHRFDDTDCPNAKRFICEVG